MIVISSSRECEKKIKNEGQQDLEILKKHSKAWVETNVPIVLIDYLKQLVVATESARDQKATGKKTEVQNLADSTIECMTLVATHILSLKHWHYVDDIEGFSAEWLKSNALDYALSYIKLGKKNDKFINQLLGLAVYEYDQLPELSHNLLGISLLYHTVFQTSLDEKKKQEKKKEECVETGEEFKEKDHN